MSHYPVLIVGEDIAAQLEPYNENTAVEPYLDSVDGEWVKALEEAREHYTPDPGWTPQQFLDSYYGVGYWTPAGPGEGNETGRGFEHWSQYNPDSKWDWYVTGGRWDGYLRTRDGAEVNECSLGELDLGEGFDDRLPHAVLKDGQWLEAGRMGWFGVVLDQKDDGAWAKEVRAALDGLPPETRITSVDCHI